MRQEYIRGKGVLMGEYTMKDYCNGKLDDDLYWARLRGLPGTNSEYIRDHRGNIIGVRKYACYYDDVKY